MIKNVMKLSRLDLPTLITLMVTAVGCLKQSSSEDLVLVFGENEKINLSEMAFYDTSSHILYFKNYHPELTKYHQTKSTFKCVHEEDIVLFSGDIWPTFLSSLPLGNYTSVILTGGQTYFLQFQAFNSQVGDERLITQLARRNKIRQGLQLRLENLEVTESLARVNFKITNQDQDQLRCFNPETMGVNLFSYYSGGLEFYNPTTFGLIYSGLDSITSVPTMPQSSWFNILDSKTSKNYQLEFSLPQVLAPGTYQVRFAFAGPTYDTSLEDLVENNIRTWLGIIRATTTLKIP